MSASRGVCDQLAINLLKSAQCAGDRPTLTHNVDAQCSGHRAAYYSTKKQIQSTFAVLAIIFGFGIPVGVGGELFLDLELSGVGVT